MDDNDHHGNSSLFNRTTSLQIMVGGLLLFVVLSEGFSRLSSYFHASTDLAEAIQLPFVHLGDKIPIPAVVAGQNIFINYRIKVKDSCNKVFIQNRILRTKTTEKDPVYKAQYEVFYSYPVSMSSVPAGTYENNEMLKLPEGLPPGDYILRRYNFMECGYTWTEVYPNAYFTVIRS